MKPCKFDEQNVIVAKDQPQYLPLPAYIDPQAGTVTSCWQGTWRERLKFLFTGRMFLTVTSFGGPLQPQRMHLDPPT